MVRLPRVEDKRAKNECDKCAKGAECRYERHACGYPAWATGWNSVAGLKAEARLQRRISVGILWKSKGVEGNCELCKSRARPLGDLLRAPHDHKARSRCGTHTTVALAIVDDVAVFTILEPKLVFQSGEPLGHLEDVSRGWSADDRHFLLYAVTVMIGQPTVGVRHGNRFLAD